MITVTQLDSHNFVISYERKNRLYEEKVFDEEQPGQPGYFYDPAIPRSSLYGAAAAAVAMKTAFGKGNYCIVGPSCVMRHLPASVLSKIRSKS